MDGYYKILWIWVTVCTFPGQTNWWVALKCDDLEQELYPRAINPRSMLTNLVERASQPQLKAAPLVCCNAAISSATLHNPIQQVGSESVGVSSPPSMPMAP